VVIDNRGGAGGTLGASIAAKAAPDGYTLFMATIAHAIAPGLYRQGLAYNFERDFAPITVVASVPNILIVNPAVPAKSEKELIAYLKANPGKVSFGSAGNGSVEHLSGELFRFMTGTDIVHIPYKGGAPMLADLMGGQIQMSIETSGAAAPYVRSGKVRALAVSTAKRSPAFPDLPTMAEAGVPGYEVTTWYGLLAPVGTPADIVNKIRDQVVVALQTPEIKKRLDDIGAEPGGMSPANFAAFIASETAKWSKVIKDSGATID
jgi:tripartite-type tricarboxylate transporter receptor subunit TctC